MPRAEYTDAPGLSLTLEPSPARLQDNSSSDFYDPGDMLRGTVTLTLPSTEDRALGSVVVNFYGRTKVKIVKSSGNTRSTYRGRSVLFDLSHVLYTGQYTHKAGTNFSWPFEFSIPTAVATGGMEETYRDSGGRFWDHEVQGRELPPNMKYIHRGWSDDARGFVEYVLTATVSEPKGLHLLMRPERKVAVRPIRLMTQLKSDTDGDGGVVRDLQLWEKTYEITIKTLRLLPAYAGSEPLGFRERSRSIFKRDSLPKMTFAVNVRYPTVIQVCSPEYIPLMVRLSVILDPEKTTIGRDSLTMEDKVVEKGEKSEKASGDADVENVEGECNNGGTFPRIIIRKFSASLQCRTSVRIPGILYDRDNSKTYTIPLVESRILNLPVDIPFPSPLSPNPSVYFDLGTSCKLRIETGNVTGGSKPEFPLVGSFKTYNVARSFRLKYVIDVECAGKSETVSNSTPFPGAALAGYGVQVVGPPKDFMNKLGPVVSLDDEDDGDDSDSGDGKGGKARTSTKGRAMSKAAEAAQERANGSHQRDYRSDGDDDVDGAAGPSGDPGHGDEQLPRYEE